MRLKQAMAFVADFGTVYLLGAFNEALQKLANDEQIDVVFVTGRLPQEEVQGFIASAKTTKQGQDSAYVLVMKNAQQGNATVTQSLMIGADGLLFEPYSVDNLVDITRLSAKVRKERSDTRLKMAISLMLNDIESQLDLLSFLKASGCEPGGSVKALRDMGTQLKTLTPEGHQMFYDLILTKWPDLPVPKRAFKTKVYKGASSRIKSRMEKKMKSELATAQTPAADPAAGGGSGGGTPPTPAAK